VAVAGGGAGQGDAHLEPAFGRFGRIEAQAGGEILEAAGEQLAVVAAGEGQGRALGLHVVGRCRGGGGQHSGQQGDGDGGGGQDRLHGASSRGGSVVIRRGSIRARVASCLTKWW